MMSEDGWIDVIFGAGVFWTQMADGIQMTLLVV